MKPRDRGVIVQVGSALAYRSIPLQSPYCGAKSALRGFTDSLRSELMHDRSGVHVTMVHLSAFNTPQFDWAKNRMPHRARPMGKIFQPEVAAESIYWAAQHRRRELWVGLPAVQAIVANRLVPGLLDRYLAYTGYRGQQTEEPQAPDRPDNLDRPLNGDHGSHGRFDKAASKRSVQLWATTHKSVLLALTIPFLVGAFMRKR
jgi:hypothetical protein